jgi:hypothetical protein
LAHEAPASQTVLSTHIVNHFPTSSSGRQTNKLPYGVCSIKLGSTRVVQHIYGAIQEYGGFEEPRWLDGPPKPRRKRKSAGAATLDAGGRRGAADLR